jgi:hypothetical protein
VQRKRTAKIYFSGGSGGDSCARKHAEGRPFSKDVGFVHSSGDLGEMWLGPLLFKGVVVENIFAG